MGECVWVNLNISVYTSAFLIRLFVRTQVTYENTRTRDENQHTFQCGFRLHHGLNKSLVAGLPLSQGHSTDSVLFWCHSSSCRGASTDGNTSPQTPTPCYFLSPNCFWSAHMCVCMCVCFHFFARGAEGKWLCKRGWCLAVRHPQGSINAYLPHFNFFFLLFFCSFPHDSFPFQLDTITLRHYTPVIRIWRNAAQTANAFRFMSLCTVLTESEPRQRLVFSTFINKTPPQH